jgi:hypothetical protein
VPLRDDAPSPPSHLLITRFDLEIEIRFVRFACLTVAVLCAGCAFAADEPLPAEPCSSSQGEMPTSMRPSSDDKTGITWYYERTTTTRFNEDAFYLYAGRKACEVWLRLRIQYVTDKPLGITHIQVRADDRTFDLPEPHVKHDSDGKLLWEWYDEQVGPGGGVEERRGALHGLEPQRRASNLGCGEGGYQDSPRRVPHIGRQALTAPLCASQSLFL